MLKIKKKEIFFKEKFEKKIFFKILNWKNVIRHTVIVFDFTSTEE